MGAQHLPSDALPSAYVTSLIRHKARQLIRKPGFSRSDEEDLVQDLTLAWLQKRGEYDPARGASIDTFADRVIGSAIKMLLRARRRKKRAAGLTATSLERGTVEVGGTHVPLAELVGLADRERVTGNAAAEPADPDLPAAIERALVALPPIVIQTAKHLMKDESVNGVARKLGVSRRQVYGAVRQLRDRLTDAGYGDD